MKIRCLLGHKKRLMPRLRERHDNRPGPKKACTRCGKLWYDYVIFVPSPERSLFSSLGPQYEGQRPPQGYGSWQEYHERMRKAIQRLVEKAK